MPSIDVAIPCYNYGRFLRAAAESALRQPGVDVRLLVVDNASTDDTLAVARALASEDPRVEVRARSVNGGATASYNDGVAWALADYFLILDADDVLAPGALERATRVLDGDQTIVFVHGVEGRIDPDGGGARPAIRSSHDGVETIGGTEFVRRLCRTPINRIGANTVVRRTAAQKRAGGYNPALPYTDDLEMWLRLATFGRVAHLEYVQAFRRYHGVRMSNQYQSMQVRDVIERERAFLSFFEREGAAMPDSERLCARARKGLGEHAYWSAVAHFCRSELAAARELLRTSRRLRPESALLPPLSWLLRMDSPLRRTGEVIAEAALGRNRG